MIIEDRLKIARIALERRENIQIAKNREYAGTDRDDGDANRNFKETAAQFAMTEEMACGIFMMKHIDAILTYLRTGKESCETIVGRLDDARAYLDIMESILIEQGKLPNPLVPPIITSNVTHKEPLETPHRLRVE